MEVEAKQLTVEASRLKKEAAKLFPGVVAAEPTVDPIAEAATTGTRTRGRKKTVNSDVVQ